VNYRLPADLLDVLVGSHRQLLATAQAAALQDGAPIGCCHAAAESVHAHTAADFRLVRTFRHSSFLALKILLWFWSLKQSLPNSFIKFQPTGLGENFRI
jgi:hypothetical protein